MKILITACFCGMLMAVNGQLMAATQVEIQWQEPEKYRDVQPSNQSRKRFRASTFKNLDEYLQELNSQLPKGTKLVMTVTDLDLAGQVFPASFTGLGQGSSDVRVIKDVDIPRMSFTYQLLSSSGEVLQESDVDLKDMSFMGRANQHFRSESLRYEKNMLKRWFDTEFSEQIAQNVMTKGLLESDS